MTLLIFALLAAAAIIVTFFTMPMPEIKERKNGDWKSRQGDDRSAEGSAATLAIDLASGTDPTASFTVRPGPVTPGSVIFTHSIPSQTDLMRRYMQNQPQTASVAQAIARQQYMIMKHAAFYGDDIFPAELRNRHATAQCKTCGAAHREKDAHTCLEPSGHDLAVVKTIQSLAEAGLDGEEIAGDMGVIVGWRIWDTSKGTLAGATAGKPAAWRLDAPVLAVCTERDCFATEKAEACKVSKKPSCRVHAFKDRAQALSQQRQMSGSHTLGMVALWGDVIECEKGVLATRAYPLAFESEIYARAYRVAKLPAYIP